MPHLLETGVGSLPNYDEVLRGLAPKGKESARSLESCGIRKAFQDVTFESMAARGIPPAMQAMYDGCRRYADHFAAYYAKGTGLLLMGNPGTGKSCCSIAVARHVMAQGYGVCVMSLASYFQEYMDLVKNGAKGEAGKWKGRLQGARLLILDDLGAEPDSKWAGDELSAIIDKRYASLLPTIATTNLTPEELKERYNGPTYDRMKSRFLPLITEGESLRPRAEW